MESIKNANLKGKKVLVRVDFNAPLKEGKVISNERLQVVLPTIKYLQEKNCIIILLSHLGRPKGKYVPGLSLKPVAEELSNLLGQTVSLAKDCIGAEVETTINNLKPKEVILLENTRFHPEDKANDSAFSKQLGALADIFVFDGFAVAHRENASTVGIQKYLPSYIGFSVEKELKKIGEILESPKKPFILVLGGAKISDKIALIKNMLPKVDKILVGGAMAFPFLRKKGLSTGVSYLKEDSGNLVAELDSDKIVLPDDFTVSDSRESKISKTVPVEKIPDDKMGLDIGPATVAKFSKIIESAGTIVWNGPLGVYENPEFAKGTKGVAEAVSKAKVSLLGGGDIVAAIELSGHKKSDFTHVSTGGGALLTLLEGKSLPALTTEKFK